MAPDEKESPMNRDYTDTMSSAAFLLGGFALGALAMYLLDPVQGNRRRALVKDKMTSARVKARKRAEATATDLANRARGLQAEARHMASTMAERAAGAAPDAGANPPG
jgi:hypothetical protein